MKTRIKVLTSKSGKQTFVPQVKKLLFWKDDYRHCGMGIVHYKFDTLEECQKHIDSLLDWHERQKQSKIVSVEYKDYP